MAIAWQTHDKAHGNTLGTCKVNAWQVQDKCMANSWQMRGQMHGKRMANAWRAHYTCMTYER
eukprot:7580703-Lingulodinium_polyedra.AAC.1